MFPIALNPLPILLTLMTSFGVLMHDTQIDHATATALTPPAVYANFGIADVTIRSNDPHIHPERVSMQGSPGQLRTGQPRLQTRDDEDNENNTVKRAVSEGLGNEYYWPTP